MPVLLHNRCTYKKQGKNLSLFYDVLYSMLLQYGPVLLILLAGMFAAVLLQKLTPAGAAAGGLIGFVIFLGAGYTGLSLMATFFILGTAATAWRKKEKIAAGIAAERESRRTAAQVAANAGVPFLLAIAALLHPAQKELYQLMLAAAFSAATADTLASELGNVYGSRYYNMLTFKKDQKGLDGVVSWEGTAAGLAGSGVIALLYAVGFGWNFAAFFIILIAGTIGNVADSVMGALWERKGRIGNDVVNFFNTAIAAAAALLLYFVL